MKAYNYHLTFGVALFGIVFGIESPAPYSVQIFLVPPIVRAKCPLAQFWYPEMVCSVCFCLTGGLSRCGPRPGCDPNDFTTTTPAPGDDVAVNPAGGAIIGITSVNSTTNSTVAGAVEHAVAASAITQNQTVSTLVTTTRPTTVATTAPETNSRQRFVARKSRSLKLTMYDIDK